MRKRSRGERGSDPYRFLTAIEHSHDEHGTVCIEAIVDGPWEAMGEQSKKSEDLSMDSCVKRQRIYVRKKGIEEVAPQSLALHFVKATTIR